jgi:hypothetical protein
VNAPGVLPEPRQYARIPFRERLPQPSLKYRSTAAKHAIENPFLHPLLGEHQILITLVILTVLTIVFLKGFNEAIGLATVAAVPYIVLNLIVLGRGASEIIADPTLLADWRSTLFRHGRNHAADRRCVTGVSKAGAGPERLRDRGDRYAAN